MADEKTLFNRNTDNDKQIHPIAKDEEMEFVDFSSAFDGDDEEDADLEEYEEEYEEPRSVPSLIKGLPFLKRKKDNAERFSEETEEIEDVHPVKKEKKDPKPQAEEKAEEIIEEQKPEKEKKSQGFSFFTKKEYEAPVKKEIETEEVPTKQTIPEGNVGEIIEIADEPEESTDEIVILLDNFDETPEKTENSVEEEIVLIEGFQEETEIPAKETVLEMQAEIVESVEKPTEVAEKTEEPEIEMLPSFEETVQVVKNIEPATEKTEESKEIEEIPPFEITIEEDAVIESVAQTEEQPEPKKKKKEKKQKAPKEKKEKKAKIIKESSEEQSAESSGEMMTMKDHLTFILIIIALLLTIAFICVNFLPIGKNNAQSSGVVTQTSKNVSEIQIQREGAVGHYIQSDIDNVFYVYSSENKLAYYQYGNNKMTPLQASGTVNAIVEIGSEVLSVKVDYVELNGELFGTGVFNSQAADGNYLHNMVIFKLANLPKGYEQDGKALLLATSNPEAVSQSCNVWNDSFVVDLATGKTTRFLTNDNNAYSTEYSILTDEGYVSTNGKIPFFTSREYDAVTNKKDIYLKDDRKETLFAQDVAGSFVYVDGDTISYLKATDMGFDVIRKENDKENIIFSLDNDTSYLYHNEYLLDKYNGNLYNVKTGEKITVKGYGMSNPEMMTVSNDGRYLVMLGTVNNAIDYQVHIFDLKTNNCAKYEDDNFSQHKNLSFIDNKTIVYSAVDPNQGYEFVMLDVSKAF